MKNTNKKSDRDDKSEVTVKSVCGILQDKLCKIQDFNTASTVREVQRVVDPKGRKKLSKWQVRTLRAFLNLVVKIEQS